MLCLYMSTLPLIICDLCEVLLFCLWNYNINYFYVFFYNYFYVYGQLFPTQNHASIFLWNYNTSSVPF